MSLRQEELGRLEWIIESVKSMKEKFFFEQCPAYKDFYKQYKKSVETFKYASDEPLYRIDDKSGLKREYTRTELLFIPLRMDYNKLLPVVKEALKAKERADELAEYKRKLENAEDKLMLGKITQEEFDRQKARKFQPKYSELGIQQLMNGY